MFVAAPVYVSVFEFMLTLQLPICPLPQLVLQTIVLLTPFMTLYISPYHAIPVALAQEQVTVDPLQTENTGFAGVVGQVF